MPAQAGEAIIVEGAKDEYARLKRTVRSGFSTPQHNPDLTRAMFEGSKRAARCAAPAELISRDLLAGVVDGVFNSPTHNRLQEQLLTQTAACGVGNSALRGMRPLPTADGPSTTEAGILLRGAVMIAVLQRYAPKVQLTPEMLHEPAVVHRFVAREEPRAKLRLPIDLQYFKVTTCLVQKDPEAAIAIVYGDVVPGDVQIAVARMIDRSRACVGGAARVAFDPIHFRVYLADSLYRWTVAAKGVDTLIGPTLRN